MSTLRPQTAQIVATAPHLRPPLSTSAVYRAPPEIWAEIFMESLHTPNGRIEIRSDDPPLMLRRVCYFWRQTAESTPRLWAAMTVSEHNMHLNGARVMAAWLARSGVLPLRISFDSAHVSQGVINSIINSILPHATRLKHLSLSVNFAATLLHSGIQLPLLEAIGLHMSMPLNISIPPSAKRLRDFILMLGPPSSTANFQIPFNFRHADVGIAWQLLSRLTICCFVGSIDSLHAILGCCTSLTYFSLDGFILSSGSVGGQRLLHSELRSLRVLTDGDPSMVLESLDLPSLTTMYVDFKGPTRYAGFWPHLEKSIVDFALRSGSLQKLILHGFNVSEDDLMWLAMFSPTIKKMSVVLDGNDLVTAAVRRVLNTPVDLAYYRQFRVGRM